MKIEDLLKYISFQQRENPNGSGLQYRAIYQEGLEDEPKVVSGWFSNVSKAFHYAKDNLENGILEGTTIEFFDEPEETIDDNLDPTKSKDKIADVIIGKQFEKKDIQNTVIQPEEVKGSPEILPRQEEKKKRGFIPWLCAGAIGLCSLPFWAIRYPINIDLPDNMLETSIPKTYKLYESVELPELEVPGQRFEGWYLDSDYQTPVDHIQYGFGTKTLYPKFVEDKDAKEMEELLSSISKLKKIELPKESLEGDNVTQWEEYQSQLEELQERAQNASKIDSDELKELLNKTHDLEVQMKEFLSKVNEEELLGVGTDQDSKDSTIKLEHVPNTSDQ